MKRINQITTLILCLFLAVSVNAQEEETEKRKIGLFVKANVGYGFSVVPSVLGQDRSLDNAENIYGTSAPGIYPGIGIGYMFNKFVGIQLAFDYSLGTSKVHDVTFEDMPASIQAAGQEFTLLNAFVLQEREFRTRQMRLSPSIIVRGGSGKLAPYARFGVMIPVAGHTDTNVRATLTSTEINLPIPIPGLPDLSGVSLAGEVEGKARTEGQFSVGFDAALGLEYQVTDLISVFGEAHLVALTIKSKQTIVSQYDGTYRLENSPISLEELLTGVNTFLGFLGQDPLELAALGLYSSIDEVPLSEKEINYVDALNGSTNNPAYNDNFDPNSALDELALRENYSSIGIQLGVKFNF